jgi:anti-sigma factor (TIGR02949 family)
MSGSNRALESLHRSQKIEKDSQTAAWTRGAKMTCQFVLSVIEEYADGELAPEQSEQVRQHLELCRQCREEYQTTLQLKKLLAQQRAPEPDNDYWRETTALILARTIETPAEDPSPVTTGGRMVSGRQALLRSVVSVAASLLLLAIAVFVGTSQQRQLSKLETSDVPVLATAPVSELLEGDSLPVITPAEQMRLAKATLLMGNPSFLGRFEGLSEMMETIE